jgi:antitoxin component YwqK of YwqJK toxin-antitoxin module
MMKKYLFLVLILMVFTACSEEEKPERPEVKMEYRPLVTEDDNGKYMEWYPGHKQLKMTGRNNKNGERVGIWKYYSERGVELSITVYNNGLRDGHTVVKYPNGAVHYSGEYLNDEPIGVWKFYNEEGQLIDTKDYSNL